MEIHLENIKEVIVQNLNLAKFNVFASVAWIGENFIIQELTNCLKRGIQVEVIVNDDERFKNYKKKILRISKKRWQIISMRHELCPYA